jgi:hypothetical protein
MLAECGFDEIEVPWKADVFRGAPQDKNSATFGTLGVNFRARRKGLVQPLARQDAQFASAGPTT